MCSTDFEDFDWYFVSRQARLRLGLVLSQASLHLGKGSEAVKFKAKWSERWWKFYTVSLGLMFENSFQPDEWCAGARSVSLVSRNLFLPKVNPKDEIELMKLVCDFHECLLLPHQVSNNFCCETCPAYPTFHGLSDVLKALCYHGLWVHTLWLYGKSLECYVTGARDPGVGPCLRIMGGIQNYSANRSVIKVIKVLWTLHSLHSLQWSSLLPLLKSLALESVLTNSRARRFPLKLLSLLCIFQQSSVLWIPRHQKALLSANSVRWQRLNVNRNHSNHSLSFILFECYCEMK